MAKIKIEKHDSVKMYRIRKTLDEISDKTEMASMAKNIIF